MESVNFHTDSWRGKDFVQIAEGASGSRSATDDVNAPLYYCRPDTMPSSRHRSQTLPGITGLVINLVLTECAARPFAAEYVDPSFYRSGCDTAPRSRKIRNAPPAISCRIVLFHDSKILMVVTVDASADCINLPGDRRRAEMIARGW